MNDPQTVETPQIQPKWQPIGRVERRVLGVLVEKAKTTPDAYPLTLNALTNGANQKSNRDPQMNLEPHQVETALEELRRLSAVIEISGSGRVAKYRHMIYEWMGVEKLEAAVMTELLLRGAQTVGELRGRAARMDPIPDVASLQPIVQSLIEKALVIPLTAPGRGQVISHALYRPDELDKLRQKVGAAAAAEAPPKDAAAAQIASAPVAAPTSSSPSLPVGEANPGGTRSQAADPELQQLRQEVELLKQEIQRMKQDMQDLWSNLK